jgi:hypothetical protein
MIFSSNVLQFCILSRTGNSTEQFGEVALHYFERFPVIYQNCILFRVTLKVQSTVNGHAGFQLRTEMQNYWIRWGYMIFRDLYFQTVLVICHKCIFFRFMPLLENKQDNDCEPAKWNQWNLIRWGYMIFSSGKFR